MSTHLPECQRWFTGMPAPDECPACEMFRACEKRILLSKPNIELSALYGYEAGRVDGINAAREAVAGSECWCGCDSSTALAAIDGLQSATRTRTSPHDSSDTGTEVPGFLAGSQEPAYKYDGQWERDLYGGSHDR